VACTADDFVEQVVVGEHRGEQLAIIVTVAGHHGLAIDRDMPLVGFVQPQQQLDQGGLAAAVAADDEQDLAGFDSSSPARP
jgi:hypothetical protein